MAPHLPQPTSDWETEVSLHVARTTATSISEDKRFYSHAWLTERGLPSQLPDELRPRADRLYPRVVEGVGISVNISNEVFKPIAVHVRRAMEDSVNDSYANGDTDPAGVRERMFRAKALETKRLVGRLVVPKAGV